MGAGAAASVHPVDLEKKVRLGARRLFSAPILYVGFHGWRFSTGDGSGKHHLRPEPGGGAQRGESGGLRTPALFRPGKDREPGGQTGSAGASHRHERPAAVRDRAAGAGASVLHLRWDIRLENLRILASQAGSCGRPHACHVLAR